MFDLSKFSDAPTWFKLLGVVWVLFTAGMTITGFFVLKPKAPVPSASEAAAITSQVASTTGHGSPILPGGQMASVKNSPGARTYVAGRDIVVSGATEEDKNKDMQRSLLLIET